MPRAPFDANSIAPQPAVCRAFCDVAAAYCDAARAELWGGDRQGVKPLSNLHSDDVESDGRLKRARMQIK
jgi:hypothetical protein